MDKANLIKELTFNGDVKLAEEAISNIRQMKNGGLYLFYGVAEKAKLVAAAALAKQNGVKGFHINLSTLLSGYIGETEKNLDFVLKSVESSRSVLFFDEADALFGKRTDIKDAHDRYANQEVSYLLSKLENYSGIVIFSIKDKELPQTLFIKKLQGSFRFH